MTGDCSRCSYWKFRGRLISWTSWLAEHLRCKESVNRPRLITERRERITVSGCGCWRRWQVKGSAVVKARKNARGLSRRPSWKRKKAEVAGGLKGPQKEVNKSGSESRPGACLIKTEPVLQRKPERGKGYSF